MVHIGKWGGRTLTVSVKPNCLTVSLADSDAAEVYSFDLAGRLWTAMRKSVAYRRGLDGKTVAKWQLPGNQRGRRWLAEAEALVLEASVRGLISDLYTDLQADVSILGGSLSADTRRCFQSIIDFDAERAREDIAGYHQVYKTVGILPPDQYMAVVLQMTEGCSFNTCTFCNFYRDRPFRIKNLDAFQQHIRAVKQLLGPGLSLRRTIFLGDANALVVPTPKLLPLVESIHNELDVDRLGGIYAFLDGFSGERKTTADYHRLAELGLKRVYIGMESGNAALLKFLNKPGEPGDVVRAVHAMKSAGVSVGIIVLLGAGGQAYSHAHIDDTVDALQQMNLNADDLLYFSELVESEGLDYTRAAFQAHLRPLSLVERIAQGEEIEARLSFDLAAGVPHISRYDIREFVY